MNIRILIVDDHPIFREGLRQLLDQQPDMLVVGEAEDGSAALEAVSLVEPNMVIMDVRMPGMSGIDAARQILSAHPHLKVVVLSALPDTEYVNEAVKAGVSGYLLKSGPSGELIRAVRAVMDGNTFLSPEITNGVMAFYRSSLASNSNVVPRGTVLSERERRVLVLIAAGLRTKEIAAQLNIKPKTIDTYRSRLMAKLRCGSTVELARYAIREGIAAA